MDCVIAPLEATRNIAGCNTLFIYAAPKIILFPLGLASAGNVAIVPTLSAVMEKL